MAISIRSYLAQRLWAQILVGLFAGIALGLTLSPSAGGLLPLEHVNAVAEWVALPGVVFLGLIQFVIVPLIVCSIILGIAGGGNVTFVKSLSSKIIPYFFITTIITIAMGIVIVELIQPGRYVDPEFVRSALGVAATELKRAGDVDVSIPQRIANLIPVNFTQAALVRDMLQIVIAAIMLGVATMALPKNLTKPFLELCTFGQALTTQIVNWAMYIAPYAVFGLICSIMIRLGFDAITGLAMYVVTILAGLLAILVFYLLIVRFISGRSIREFVAACREVQLMAFSTSSSAAVMPLAIETAEKKLHVRSEIARFVIPVGTTVNMDGTAMYQAAAAIFLCQLFGIDLTFGETMMLLFTTVGASLGTPATPGVGIVILATILTTIGVPPEGIGIILGVDRILDMCRTTINVTGDMLAVTVMEKWMKKDA